MSFPDKALRIGKKPVKLTLILALPFVIFFIFLLAVLIAVNYRNHKNNMLLQMKTSAKAYFEQIVLTRLWNAEHSGVYVEVTESISPNPYLDSPDRDIVSVGGRKYTKINPAFMTRQLSEIADRNGRYKFHITSLSPINPDNRPDQWEEGMLRTFEKGKTEGFEITDYQGQEYFRYMAPLEVTWQCLQCHEKRGYKLGDILGGISISMPTAPIRSVHGALFAQSSFNLVIVGLLALAVIVYVIWVLSRRLIDGLRKELEGEKLKIAMQLSVAAAHELRQPMTTIMGFAEILRDKQARGESVVHEMEVIISQCRRMNDTLARMLKITSYRTRVYDANTEILDLQDPQEPSADRSS